LRLVVIALLVVIAISKITWAPTMRF